MSDERAAAVQRIAEEIVRVEIGRPVRVAVDGITASGKSTLADELAGALRRLGHPADHISMDGFHHLRAHRQRRGRMSADGYYEDAYDFAALRIGVLEPLGPGGDRRYRRRVMDLATDQLVDEAAIEAPADLVLVVDGTFLQRAELAGCWDVVVFVDTGFSVAEDRGARRDAAAFGSEDAARAAFRARYHAACRRYVAEVGPAASADVVLHNDDLAHPVVALRASGPHAMLDG